MIIRCLFCLAFLFSVQALAAPPIWETDFGSELTDLTGDDDEETSVTLSFPFPFEGTNYTTIFVGTNGGLQLGDLGDDSNIDYDHSEYMEEFISDLAPSIAVLNTDIDLTTTGTIHFNDFGGRAVFTWNEVGTHQNEMALSSFQIQLEPSGRIVFGYDGILDDPSEDLITDLDEGIVVGITDGSWPNDGTEPGPTDLSGSFSSASPHVYDRWCNDVANSCGFGGDDDGLPGPVNTAFDLDQRNVVFVPNAGGGFTVNGVESDLEFRSVPTMTSISLFLMALILAGLAIVQISRRF